MTGFWFLIAAPFEALFSIMPSVGAIINILLISAGFIACFIWIGIMVKEQKA
jgi:hypothetical protein